jgi:N-acetylmuramoyl-L-alanine amidase
MPITAEDLWVLASTVWGEARGEPREGKYAVAWVVRNRLEHHPTWQGKTVMEVCRSPWQFSCWNIQDPNYTKVVALTMEDLIFVTCLHIAVDVLGNEVASPVGRATHYYSGTRVPAWARGKTPVRVLGRHRFFEDIA